nr:MAG TPA: hypothetical protein [Caudoviricetes sp.]
MPFIGTLTNNFFMLSVSFSMFYQPLSFQG